MGFFDRKAQDATAAAQQQAQQAMQQAGMGGGYDPAAAMRQAGMDPNAAMAGASMGNMQELMAERDRIQRLNASGVEAKATVISAQPIAASPGGSGMDTQSQLSVTSGPGAGSTISVKQSMIGDSAWYQPGQQVTLKVNPANPQEALIFGQA